MKDRFVIFTSWIELHWLALVVFMVCLMLGFVCVVFFSWSYGYWSNGLYGTKFEINSCWTGISSIVAGLGGIAALAKAGWTKYNTDSQFNTPNGKFKNGGEEI